ncbi:DUF881 domain-containing protein [Clostridium tarantellae]|uniref:DUF881 domain-containing protein n=1 Tax=Clostridium tarantellae TaxID=39493 RepID=A0A6I1MLW3_9CLOT|nr:DUF881 domain-containing protein [Clostridium tarantellae]MPQ43990.1 DUF881 domain-containing protein [Clostridium tarantellae]
MNKKSSQIAIALVCAILGFMVAYQFKLLNKKEQNILESYDKTDIMAEIEGLKKEKAELGKKNESLLQDLKKLEEAAVSKGDVNNQIKEELDKTRMILGIDDVKGPGIILYITPKSPLLTANNAKYISENELVHILNVLAFSGAEAISINDYRITPQTGIKNASNFIWIGNNERISPKDNIVIKAIGEPNNLIKGITFTGEMDYGVLGGNYDYKYEKKDEIVINKSTQNLVSDYLKKVK